MKKIGLLLLVIFILFQGCAANRRMYNWLSVFLDTMPSYEEWSGQGKKEVNSDKNAVEKKPTEENQVQKNEKVEIYPHPPWQDNKCETCHSSTAGMRALPEPELCYACHQDKKFSKVIVRGDDENNRTEAQGQKLRVHPALWFVPNCTYQCHVSPPHFSDVPKLLKAEPKVICVSCHEAPEIMRGMNCVNCHEPHASRNRKLLKW